MKDVRIVFMGTPEIAVATLRQIVEEQYSIAAVITTPDKPSGRGLKLHESAVKQFAVEHKLNVLQPDNLSDESFISTIKDISPDLIIVVAFRKIPDVLLEIPKIGSFNLHASLLPQYRGAAPINWAIINGETQTGLTSFLLNNRIDEGKILLQETIEIKPSYNASDLYDIMKVKGALLVSDTIKMLVGGNYKTIDQEILSDKQIILKKAPKIFKDHCRISWNDDIISIQNRIRGLSYIPGAYTELISPNNERHTLKILRSEYTLTLHKNSAGSIETDNNKYLRIFSDNGFIDLKEVQLSGKKIMNVDMLLRGFKLNNHWLAS